MCKFDASSKIPQQRGPWLGQGKSKSKHVCPHIGSWPTDEWRVDIRSQDRTIQRSAVDGFCSRLSRLHGIAEGIPPHKGFVLFLFFCFSSFYGVPWLPAFVAIVGFCRLDDFWPGTATASVGGGTAHIPPEHPPTPLRLFGIPKVDSFDSNNNKTATQQ